MANKMDPFVAKLQEASGHEARDIMIDGLKTINEGEFNATTFNGKKENEYLKEYDMSIRIRAKIDSIKKDNEPDENSENLITTQGIRSLTGKVPFAEN